VTRNLGISNRWIGVICAWFCRGMVGLKDEFDEGLKREEVSVPFLRCAYSGRSGRIWRLRRNGVNSWLADAYAFMVPNL
jgi:hypothetical protein